jgi:hypothetical protein
MIARIFILALVLLLAGCDLAALLADPKVVQREADGKAVGSACRHGLRSIEDCYSLNEKAPKSAVFAGWKDMDLYMRENNIEGIAPQGLKPVLPEEEMIDEPKPKKSGSEKPVADAQGKSADKPIAKTLEKAEAKESTKAGQ